MLCTYLFRLASHCFCLASHCVRAASHHIILCAFVSPRTMGKSKRAKRQGAIQVANPFESLAVPDSPPVSPSSLATAACDEGSGRRVPSAGGGDRAMESQLRKQLARAYETCQDFMAKLRVADEDRERWSERLEAAHTERDNLRAENRRLRQELLDAAAPARARKPCSVVCGVCTHTERPLPRKLRLTSHIGFFAHSIKPGGGSSPPAMKEATVQTGAPRQHNASCQVTPPSATLTLAAGVFAHSFEPPPLSPVPVARPTRRQMGNARCGVALAPRMCVAYARGECVYGARCFHMHSESDAECRRATRRRALVAQGLASRAAAPGPAQPSTSAGPTRANGRRPRTRHPPVSPENTPMAGHAWSPVHVPFGPDEWSPPRRCTAILRA